MELAREAGRTRHCLPLLLPLEKKKKCSPFSQGRRKMPTWGLEKPRVAKRRGGRVGEMIKTQKHRLTCWINIEREKIEFKDKKSERYWGEKFVKFKTRIFLFLWVLGKFSLSLSLRQENWSCSSSVWDHRSLVCFLPMAYYSQFAKHCAIQCLV